MSTTDPRGKKRQSRLARKFYDAHWKTAGLLPLQERYGILEKRLGSEHALVALQREKLQRMKENLDTNGEEEEFRTLASEVGELQWRCKSERGMR